MCWRSDIASFKSVSRILCAAIFYTALSAAEDLVQHNRALQQDQDNVVHVTEENIQFLDFLVQAADRGTEFVFKTVVQLPGLIEVTINRLRFRGDSKNRPTLRCADGKGAFQINSNRVMLKNLIIRNCSRIAVSVFTEGNSDYSPNPDNHRYGMEPLDVIFQNVDFIGNGEKRSRRDFPGAVLVREGVYARVVGCRFEKNRGDTGGAILFNGTALVVKDSVFIGNVAENGGGAIFADRNGERGEAPLEARVGIHSCAFAKNRVRHGAIKYSFGEIPIESNRIIAFPNPSSSGGAIYASGWKSVSIRKSKFTSNNAVAAGGAVHMSENEVVLIENCRFLLNSVQGTQSPQVPSLLQQGGALFISQSKASAELVIQKTDFVRNRGKYGGGFHYLGPKEADVRISGCTFKLNHADAGGGALLLRNVENPVLSGTTFTKNSAVEDGGAILLTNEGGLEIDPVNRRKKRTSFRENNSTHGGALFAEAAGDVTLQGTLFANNRAVDTGGAMAVINSPMTSAFVLEDVRMINNVAQKGGAIFLSNVANATVKSSAMKSKAASRSQRDRPRSEFQNNMALSGGAIYYETPPTEQVALLIKGVRFRRNCAVADDALMYASSCIGETSSESPTAKTNGRMSNAGMLYKPTLLDVRGQEPCKSGGGGALCAVLLEVSKTAGVSLQITGSSFSENSAVRGGAMVIATDPDVSWRSECSSLSETTNLTIPAEPCKSVALQDTRFAKNHALSAGGGIMAFNLTHVSVAKTEHMLNSKSENSITNWKGNRFVNNSVGKRGYGSQIATPAVSLAVASPRQNPDTGLILPSASGGLLRPLPPIKIQILDVLNQVVSDGILDSEFLVHVRLLNADDSSVASGQLISTSESGTAVFSALYLKARPNQYELEFFSPRNNIESVQANVTLRECSLGESFNEDRFSCEGCPFEYFTFYNSSNCQKCPEHARCEGNASLIPLPGYWHSSPFSVIIHPCISKTSCSDAERLKTLQKKREAHLHEFHDLLERGISVMDDMYPQCNVGHNGPLCGSCANGYGRASGNECRKCNHIHITVLVFAVLVVWQLILLLMTTRSALVSVKDMHQMAAVVKQQTQIQTNHSRRVILRTISGEPAQARESLGGLERTISNSRRVYTGLEQSTPVADEIAANFTGATGEDASSMDHAAEYIIASQHLSETIKIIINFLQITSVVAEIDLNWTFSLKKMLTSLSAAVGLTGTTSLSPTTCLLNIADDDRTVYEVILRTAVPLLLMALLFCGFVFMWIRMRQTSTATTAECQQFIRSRIIVCCLVTSFFVYQSFAESFIGIFSCIEVDSKELSEVIEDYDNQTIGVSYSNFSLARGNYWIKDTRIECFKGSHAYLVSILGVPGIVLFLGGLPVYLLAFLLYKRQKDQLKDINVLNTHGFIYQNYEDSFVYWEVSVLVRKALIAVVVVFAYPLGPHLQAVLSLGVLMLAVVLHMTARPFKYLPLNLLEGSSLSVSILTLLIGLIFNDDNTSHVAVVFLSVLLILINACLVLIFLFALSFYFDKFILGKMKYFGASSIPGNPLSRALFYTSFHVEKVFAFVRSSMSEVFREKGSEQMSERSEGSDRRNITL